VPPRAQTTLFGFSVSLPLPALGMVDNGPQIGLCVLVVTRNGGRIIPKALKRAEQVIKVISGHPDADTQNAGVEDQPSTIPATAFAAKPAIRPLRNRKIKEG
jgi:hypothetical protein